jgi:hypothetical protein
MRLFIYFTILLLSSSCANLKTTFRNTKMEGSSFEYNRNFKDFITSQNAFYVQKRKYINKINYYQENDLINEFFAVDLIASIRVNDTLVYGITKYYFDYKLFKVNFNYSNRLEFVPIFVGSQEPSIVDIFQYEDNTIPIWIGIVYDSISQIYYYEKHVYLQDLVNYKKLKFDENLIPLAFRKEDINTDYIVSFEKTDSATFLLQKITNDTTIINLVNFKPKIGTNTFVKIKCSSENIFIVISIPDNRSSQIWKYSLTSGTMSYFEINGNVITDFDEIDNTYFVSTTDYKDDNDFYLFKIKKLTIKKWKN